MMLLTLTKSKVGNNSIVVFVWQISRNQKAYTNWYVGMFFISSA